MYSNYRRERDAEISDERDRLAQLARDEDDERAALRASDYGDDDAPFRVIEFALDGWLRAVTPARGEAFIAPGLAVRVGRRAA